MTQRTNELVDLHVFLRRETDSAWLVNDGIRVAWVPKSLCELEPHESGRGYTLTMPRWLAEEKELV